MPHKVALIAAPYGFGPSSKAVAISSHLQQSIECVYFGFGPAVAMAQNSRAFSACVSLDFNQSPETVSLRLAPFDLIIFVNTTRFVSAVAATGKPMILVETLAWLRDKPPAVCDLLSAYFAQQFFRHPFSPKLEALANFMPVGPILPSNILAASGAYCTANSNAKSPLIHCGGLFSPAMSGTADHEFVARALKTVNILDQSIRAYLPSYLQSRLRPQTANGIELLDCSPVSINDQIIGSEFCLTTTGIEFTYESLALGVPTLFLPPFNASQFYQLEYHRKSSKMSVPFNAGTNLPAAGFSGLDKITTSLQDAGLAGLWCAQFDEIEGFLRRLNTSEKDNILSAVRETQRNEMQHLLVDGAQSIARHVLQQIGVEVENR